MRAVTLSALLALLLLSAHADAQKRETYPDIWESGGLKPGAKGYWYANGQEGRYYETKVVEIIDRDTMVMKLGRKGFVVANYPTKDLADGEVHHLKGPWKVTGTRKYLGTTYRVVEPVK